MARPIALICSRAGRAPQPHPVAPQTDASSNDVPYDSASDSDNVLEALKS